MLNGFIRHKVDMVNARLVGKGYKKNLSINYFEVFPSVVKLETIHMLITLVLEKNGIFIKAVLSQLS